MASYTVGTAAWTNGSRKVTFAYLSARHALFASSADSLTSAAAPPLNTTALTNQTLTGSIVGPAGAYDVKDTYNEEITITGASTEIRWIGDYNDAYYTTQTTSGGATHATIVIRTTGNTVDGAWRLRFRPTISSDTGSTYINLPATPDGVWTELTVPLSATHTGMLRQLILTKTAGGNFTVGNKVCMAGAYIHNNNNVVVRPTDTITPDYGVTNFTVDKVVHNYNSTGPILVVYTSEVYTGTTSSGITTQRTEVAAGVSRTFAADITVTAGASASLHHTRNLTADIPASLNLSSVLSSQPLVIRAFTADIGTTSSLVVATLYNIGFLTTKIRSKAKIIPSVTIKPVRPLGNAVWTNGSNIVDGSSVGNPLSMALLQAPYGTVDNSNNGLSWYAQDGLNINDSWGTNVGYVDGIASAYLGYQVKLLPNVQNGGVSYTYGGADQGEEYCDGAVLKTSGGYAANTSGYTAVCITAALQYGTQYQFSLSAEADTGLNLTTNVRNISPPDGIYTWHNYEYTGLSTSGGINKMSIFREFSSWYNSQLLVDSVMFYNPNNKNIVKPFDKISPDGGLTNYTVLKVLLNSSNKPTYVISQPYTGETGTFGVLRTYAPVVYERSFHSQIENTTTVKAPTFTRLQYLKSLITNAGAALGSLKITHNISSTIGATSTTINTKLSKLQSMVSGIAGSSIVTSTVDLTKSLVSGISAIGNNTAVEFIRYKFYDSAISAVSAITKAHIGQWRYVTTAVDAVSNITSNTTKLIFYTTQIVTNGASMVVSKLGYAKIFISEVLTSISNVITPYFPITRGVTTTIESVSKVDELPIHLLLDYNTHLDETVTSVTARPNFITGMMPVTIAAVSNMSPLHIILRSAFNSTIAAEGSLTTSGEFRPIKFLSVIINADSSITSHFIRDVTINGVIYNEAEINASINKVLVLTSGIDADSKVKSYLSVPEKLRQLLVTSSGVLINGSDSIVNFSTKEETTPITVRGLTVVQFNDVVTGTNKTVIMLD